MTVPEVYHALDGFQTVPSAQYVLPEVGEPKATILGSLAAKMLDDAQAKMEGSWNSQDSFNGATISFSKKFGDVYVKIYVYSDFDLEYRVGVGVSNHK